MIPAGQFIRWYASDAPAYVMATKACSREDFKGQQHTLLVDSMMKIYRVGDVGYLAMPCASMRYGGSYIMAGAARFKEITDADIALKVKDALVVYDAPGYATLAVAGYMGELMRQIVEGQ